MMNSRLLNYVKQIFWCSLILVLVSSASHADSATFQIHIQDRPGYPPAARIKTTLKTSGAVAGATVTINGATIGGLPAVVTVPGVGSLDNGDSVFVAPVTGDPNSVGILYEPLNRITDPDWCHYKGGMNGDQTISLTFAGPTIAGYRLTTYSAAGSIGVLPADCSKAPRRVRTFPAVWTMAPPGADLGREPLDAILVLDESGSMGDPPPSDPVVETKWNVLTESVKQFVALWQLTDSSVSDDRLGLMFYSSASDPADFGGGSIFQPRGTNLTACNPANYCEAGHNNWCQVMCKLGAKGPGGSTAMGPGLRDAINAWKADKRNDPSVVLMTDGIQNVAPCIVPDGQSGCSLIVAGSDMNWKFDGDVDPIFKQGIPVATVSMGLASGPPQDVLDGIAKENAGISLKTSSSSTSAAAFADTLVNILKGNTLSLLSRSASTMPSVSTFNPPVPVLLDGSVKRAVIMLGWQGHGNEGALDLVIQKPGGTTVVPVKREDGTFFTAQAVDLPTSGPIGNWSIQVIRKPAVVIGESAPPDLPSDHQDGSAGGPSDPSPNEAPFFQQRPDVPYQLSVYSAESRLEYRLNATRSTVGTGDSLKLEVEISYDGKPLTGLGSGLTVHIDRPSKGLGTILHNTDVPDDALNTEPSPGDITGQYERKVLYLAKNAGLSGSVEPQPIATTYALSDNGNPANGDIKKDDGVYTANITDTSMPGLYKLRVTLDWDVPLTGKIHRVETLPREVKVNVDSTKSIVGVSKGAEPGKWFIKVEPVDKFGNYMGPGFTNSFKVQVNGGGSVSGAPNDARQTGAYNITLVGVPAGADPVVSISVDGHEIRNCKLTALGNCSGSHQLSKFTVFADLGVAIPHGTFSNVVDPGVSFNGGLEYIAKPNFSAEGIFGVHHFTGKIGGSVTAIQFTGGGKAYLMNGPNRPFVRAGLGGYHFTSGTTNFGGYFGGGLLHEFNSHLGLDVAYTFHAVNTPGIATKFSTIQGGVRYAF